MSKGIEANVRGRRRGSLVGEAERAAVLRLLKGEDLDTVSRELKVTASTLSEWREVFLANELAGLKSREVDSRDEKIAALKKALAENGAGSVDFAGDQRGVREESRPFSAGEVDVVRHEASVSLEPDRAAGSGL